MHIIGTDAKTREIATVKEEYESKGYKKTVNGIYIHTPEDFVGMRKAGALAKSTLDYIEEHVKPGASTSALNDLCHEFITSKGATSAPLWYKGFPKSICTSVNHVVCHGIPSETEILKEEDILNIDITVILNGYHGDTSRMFLLGNKAARGRRLCEVTKEAMELGIEKAKPGNTLRDIAIAIENYVKKNGYSCVRDFCGHGIGKVFHMEPQIMHYNEPKCQQDIVLEEGMFFTIEPMVNMGKYKVSISETDGWTATTKDKTLSAQYEHTIGITKNGNEVFTR
jgi:methionyl aminopeptidase